MSSSKKYYLPGMLGSAIESYDVALYGCMAPVLVKVFLPQIQKTHAYFFYFLFEFFATLCQLGGARFFGRMGDLLGRKKTMYRTIIGTSFATFAVSILPTYEHIGITATVLFAMTRAMQSFFLGGEYNGGAIYCLEHEVNHKKHGLVSGLYCAFIVSGIFLANFVATLTSYYGHTYFRIAYGVSFLLAVFTCCLRRKFIETPEYSKACQVIPAVSIDIKNEMRYRFIALVIASLFFGALYGLPSRIFGALLPLVTNITNTQIMAIHSSFLILYALLLIAFGILSDKIGHRKAMNISVIATILATYPLTSLIQTKTLIVIVFVKAIFIILAAAFIGPFHAWAQELFVTRSRYNKVSTAFTLGKCCSTLILAISVPLFECCGSLKGPGIVLILCASIAAYVFRKNF